jgi:hypothetical protein
VAPTVSSVKAIPWRLVLEVATVVVNRFRDDVPPGDRQRLTRLVRKSKGDPRRLTASERSEILKILRRLDVQRLGRDVTGVVGANRLRRRLRR